MTHPIAMVGLLAGLIACQSDMRSGINPHRDSSRVTAEGFSYQLAYQVGPAPDCSNWYAALRKARVWAGCDSVDNTRSGSPPSPCRQRIQECDGGCDICPILGTGLGPPANFEDLGPLKRDGNVIFGKRGRQSIGRSFSTFNTRLCEEMAWIDVLGSTMLHEAMHHCRGGFGISDFISNQSGCSANALERFCTGIESGEGT